MQTQRWSLAARLRVGRALEQPAPQKTAFADDKAAPAEVRDRRTLGPAVGAPKASDFAVKNPTKAPAAAMLSEREGFIRHWRAPC